MGRNRTPQWQIQLSSFPPFYRGLIFCHYKGEDFLLYFARQFKVSCFLFEHSMPKHVNANGPRQLIVCEVRQKMKDSGEVLVKVKWL